MPKKTKHIHDSEQVVQLQIDIKCMKSTNLARIFEVIKRHVDADYECRVMNDTPKWVNKTKEYKDKQDAETS